MYRALLYRNIRAAGAAIFYFNGLTGSLLFFVLATKWQSLIKSWRRFEDCFLREPYELGGLQLKSRILLISVILLIFSTRKF